MTKTISKCLCILLIAHLGCRPREAALIIMNPMICKSKISVPTIDHNYIVKIAARYTKTNVAYTWLIPPELDNVMDYIKLRKRHGYKNLTQIANYARSYFNTTIVKDAGLHDKTVDNKPLTFRMMRATKAT